MDRPESHRSRAADTGVAGSQRTSTASSEESGSAGGARRLPGGGLPSRRGAESGTVTASSESRRAPRRGPRGRIRQRRRHRFGIGHGPDEQVRQTSAPHPQADGIRQAPHAWQQSPPPRGPGTGRIRGRATSSVGRLLRHESSAAAPAHYLGFRQSPPACSNIGFLQSPPPRHRGSRGARGFRQTAGGGGCRRRTAAAAGQRAIPPSHLGSGGNRIGAIPAHPVIPEAQRVLDGEEVPACPRLKAEKTTRFPSARERRRGTGLGHPADAAEHVGDAPVLARSPGRGSRGWGCRCGRRRRAGAGRRGSSAG